MTVIKFGVKEEWIAGCIFKRFTIIVFNLNATLKILYEKVIWLLFTYS